MPDTRVFQSSFDSTRFTGADGKDSHPNLAQAQAEAVTNLLLGHSLLLNNSYAFDSRIVLHLIRVVLETRQQVRLRASEAGRQRINDASPIILRWYSPESGTDFLACCADQLRRLTPAPRRLILSYWQPIDSDDKARMELADALTSAEHRMPDFVRDHDGMAKSFETLLRFNDYCRRQDRGHGTSGARITLLAYLQDFEAIEVPSLMRMHRGMREEDRIDFDTVMKLREAIKKVDPKDKANRSWAHGEVERNGGEQAPSFLLQQRQLIDTLYNEALADSVGCADRDLLSSVPRSIRSADLDKVNAFALELINQSKIKRQQDRSAASEASEEVRIDEPGSRRVLSELFRTAAAEPELEAPPLEGLLTAYWELIADDDRWLAWSDSCDNLRFAFQHAQRLKEARHAEDSRLGDAWSAHLGMLKAQLPHIRATERALVTTVRDGDVNYQGITGFDNEYGMSDPSSLATARYIDRYLRGFFG